MVLYISVNGAVGCLSCELDRQVLPISGHLGGSCEKVLKECQHLKVSAKLVHCLPNSYPQAG